MTYKPHQAECLNVIEDFYRSLGSTSMPST